LKSTLTPTPAFARWRWSAGQEVAAVLAEAVALLDSVVDLAGPDIAEDRRRYDEFKQTRLAVPLDDVKAWVASWGSANELPRPQPRKVG
jgi:hypothetical protein